MVGIARDRGIWRMTEFTKPRLTTRFQLRGGQDRLRRLIIYIAHRCADAKFFGQIKLNKILWKADFDAFAARGVPVTGRDYQRLPLGPAPKEMKPLYRDMLKDGIITTKRVEFGEDNFGNKITEFRTIPLVPADLSLFEPDDIAFVDAAIEYYWDMTGTETSDDSHGMFWKTHNNGDPLPYELAILSDEPLDKQTRDRIIKRAKERGWNTD